MCLFIAAYVYVCKYVYIYIYIHFCLSICIWSIAPMLRTYRSSNPTNSSKPQEQGVSPDRLATSLQQGKSRALEFAVE